MKNKKKKPKYCQERQAIYTPPDIINSPPPNEGPLAGSMGNTEDRQGTLGEDSSPEE